MKKNIKEQMTFSDNSRPSPDVETAIRQNQTSFKDVDILKPNEPNNYIDLLASEQYKSALDKLNQYTGEQNIGTGTSQKYAELSMKAFNALNQIKESERNHKEELEKLCVDLIIEHFNIPEGALQFNFKLANSVSTQIEKKKQTKEDIEQKEPKLANEINNLTKERAKRRLINAMIQGNSVDSTYLFNKIADKIVEITGDNYIIEKYAILSSVMMLGYWQFPDQMLSSAMGGGGGGAAAGKASINLDTDPPTINAESIVFPFLIHEAIKGVMEFLSTQKEPTENELLAKDLEDELVHEIWDIRIGPAIWRRLLDTYPETVLTNENEKKLTFYLYQELVNTPAREFLAAMKEIIQKTEIGKKLIGAMFYDLKTILDGEIDDESETQYRRVMNELLPKDEIEDIDVDDIDIDDFLSELGFK